MSRTVRINLELLQTLVRLKRQLRASVIKVADESLVTAIRECFLNILNGNVPISAAVKRKLGRYKQPIRSIAASSGSWKSKRALLLKNCEKLVPLVLVTTLDYLKDESR